jgi:hypothetical protein
MRFTEWLTLHTPQATVHSSLVAEAWLAWHSIPNQILVLEVIAFHNAGKWLIHVVRALVS